MWRDPCFSTARRVAMPPRQQAQTLVLQKMMVSGRIHANSKKDMDGQKLVEEVYAIFAVVYTTL
jgi:hypothetical protein